MATKNRNLIEQLDACSKALDGIEKSRGQIAAAFNSQTTIGARVITAKSGAYKALDAAFAAVIELQRQAINQLAS